VRRKGEDEGGRGRMREGGEEEERE